MNKYRFFGEVHAVDQEEQHVSDMQRSGERCSTGGWRMVVANKMYGTNVLFFFLETQLFGFGLGRHRVWYCG